MISPAIYQFYGSICQNNPIGYCTKLEEDDYGLHMEGAIILSASKGRSAYDLIKSSSIRGLSIGYDVKDSHYDDDGIRYLTDLKLYEISIVTFPANQDAGICGVKYSDQDLTYRKLCNVLDKARLCLNTI